MGANELDDLSVAVGCLAVLAASFVDHPEPIVAVMHIGKPTQQVARGLLGFIEAAGLDQIDDGIGSRVEAIGVGEVVRESVELGALGVEFSAPGREHGVLGGLVLVQAAVLVLPGTAAGTRIVATDLRH